MANKPNNPALWSRAKSMAKQKYDVYPSAYANGWASKWYKSHGGSWRKAEYGMEVMGDGGAPDNAGFNALPEAVQQKIIANMGYGGYIPEMMYGGYDYMAEGGEPNGGMALGQMAAVADKMNKLRQFISPEQNLDPWIASKLAVIDDSAAAISDYMMYNPEAQEMEEGMPEMGRGGYTVTRSNDRKGKTHKVTGPDGTVKYFGDSNLGQHPGNPKRKAAFYARHKKNLAGNPFFRAFARKTWEDGGSTFSGNAFYQNGGEPQIQDYPDYNSYMAALQQYQSYYGDMDTPQQASQEMSPRWHSEWDEQGIDPQNIPTGYNRKLNDYKGVSIVDFLASQGINKTDYASRKQLAKILGISNYTGRGDQNMQLIQLLKNSPDILDTPSVQNIKPGAAKKSAPKSKPSSAISSNVPSNVVKLSPEEFEKFMANRTTISQAKGPNPAAASNRDPWDDSYMLNKIANDPGTPANINKRKRKEFFTNLAVGTLAPWLAEGALMAATTRYLPMAAGYIPEVVAASRQASKALPYATRALPYQKGGQVMDVTPEQAEELRRQGYQFEIL